MNKTYKLEAIFWSIAFPGFGQLLNGHLIKGVLLEFTIYVMNSFIQAIMFNFLGKITEAGRANPRLSFVPFAFGAYFVTIGLMYSPNIIFGISFGLICFHVVFNTWVRNWIYYSFSFNKIYIKTPL